MTKESRPLDSGTGRDRLTVSTSREGGARRRATAPPPNPLVARVFCSAYNGLVPITRRTELCPGCGEPAPPVVYG